jgi:hypothetical protein
VDVARLSRHPGRASSTRLLGHHSRVRVEALAVKRGQHELALVEPAVAVGEEHAARQQRVHQRSQVRLAEVGAVGDEDVVHQLRPAHDHHVFHGKPEPHDVGGLGAAAEEFEPVVLKFLERRR